MLRDSVVPVFAITNDYEPTSDTEVLGVTPSGLSSKTGPTDLVPLAEAAIAAAESDSLAGPRAAERALELSGLRWEALPSLNVSASLRDVRTSRDEADEDNADHVVRIGLQQSLMDFGRHASRVRSAEIELDRATIERWEERNERVREALSQYVEIQRHDRLHSLSTEYVALHEELESTIRLRFEGGVSERSEASLIELRLQELLLQLDSDQLRLQAAKDELVYQTRLSETAIDRLAEGSEASLETALSTVSSGQSMDEDSSILQAPVILHAELGIRQAAAARTQTRSTLLPGVVVEVFNETSNNLDEQGVELRLETRDFAGFAYRSRMRSADATIETARSELAFQRRELQQEIQRLVLERQNLAGRRASLEALQTRSEESRELFTEQFKAGIKPVVDAIRVYEGTLDAARKLVDVDADLALNRINHARLLGQLAGFPES